MKAVMQKKGSEELFIGAYEQPDFDENDLLIKVKATALNRGDLLQKRGLYPPPEGTSPILGLEFSGTVIEVGEKVNGWKKGDRVFSILPGGGYAELVSIPSELAMKIPENLSFIEAAAIPEAFLTAFLNMHLIGNLKRKETILIHAGAGGIGTAAIQLARATGANIITTAGSQKKIDYCKALGADVVVNYKQNNFLDSVLQYTDSNGVDLIFDFIGSPYWDDNMKSLAKGGRWIIIGVLGGYEKTVNLREIMRKHANIIGSTLRTRSNEFKSRLIQEFAYHALPKFTNGELKPIIDSVYSWEDVNKAHSYLESNDNIGKVLLKIDH